MAWHDMAGQGRAGQGRVGEDTDRKGNGQGYRRAKRVQYGAKRSIVIIRTVQCLAVLTQPSQEYYMRVIEYLKARQETLLE